MKKQLFSMIAAACVSTAFAQLPVSTAPENKKMVLEEYTGIYCGYCPDGHQIANGIYENNPDNVILINIHTGPFAAVAPGEPDLTTYIGAQIGGMPGMKVMGYPAGDVNRRLFSSGSQTVNGMAGDRSAWAAWSASVLAEPAYCNVALEGFMDTVSVIDENTGNPVKILTVNAEVYYTASSPAATNSITIFLLEDSIRGPQHNYGSPYYNLANYNADGSYNHNHVLRAQLTTGNYGQKIANTASGTTFTTSVTYTVPASYGASGKETYPNVQQMRLAAFVTESFKNTINGNHGPITFRANPALGIKNNSGSLSNVALFPNPANDAAKVRINSSKAGSVSVKVYNQVGQMVYESGSKDLAAGITDFELATQNWAAGLYNVLIQSSQGSVAKKLNVVK